MTGCSSLKTPPLFLVVSYVSTVSEVARDDTTMHKGLADPVANSVPYPRSTGSGAHLVTASGIELHGIPAGDGRCDEASDDGIPGPREFSLPPVDEGKDAWLCLMGAFVLEMVVWGMF